MSARIRHHIRSNVIGYLALFVALSGTAYATHPGGADTISSADIIDNTVRTNDIRDGNLATADIDTNAITSGKIADDAVTGQKIANDAIQGFQIIDGTLTGDDFLGYSDQSLENFPSISAGNCSRLEIPVRGRLRVSHVVVTPPDHFADTFTLTGKMRSIDPGTSRVVLVACNVFGGGGAADPDGGGGNYGFLVILDD